MTLSPCRTCGHEVSERAVACPNCGEPRPVAALASPDSAQDRLLRATPSWLMVLIAVVVVAFLGLVLVAQLRGMS